MAASSKPTAVHFALVFFVMFTLILSVVLYLKWTDASEFQAQLRAEQDSARELSNALDRQLAFEQEVKDIWGNPSTQTLTEDIANDLGTFGGAQSANTVSTTLSQMRTEIDNLAAQVATLNTGLTTSQTQTRDAERNAQDRVDQIQASQQDSETQLQALITRHEEEIAERDATIQQWQNDYRAVQAEKENVIDEFRRATDDWNEREHLYNQQITFLTDQVQELTKVSFERADGRIVNVDNNTRTVWINLGHLDLLQPQVTFSVYTKNHRGIGRGVEDIKAKIEVTRLLGPHMAEARILEEDLSRPIGESDPIYSPLWSAGRTEYFAFVGRVDLDEDGDADLDQLQEIVHNAGGEIDLYVDDEGLRVPADAGLSARTKFLVIGDLDDPADFSGQTDKQDLAERVLNEQKALIDESRLYGIRVVRLNDFLDYIGFRPQQRLWRPGEERPFNLRNGARSASVNEALEDRLSTGTVSELFRNNTGRSSSSGASDSTSGTYRQ